MIKLPTSLVLLLVSVASISLSSVTTGITFIFASTEESEGGGDEGGGSEEQESEPEPEPTPEPIPQPMVPPVVQQEETPIECPEGFIFNDGDQCIPEPVTEAAPQLPLCDGSFQDCITPNGDICLAGQGGHECECAVDMSNCPQHPSLQEPEETPPDEPPGIDPCLLDPDNAPECPDPDPVTGECPEGYNMNENGNCYPEHPNGCPEGYHSHEDDESGRCIPDSTPCQPDYIRNPEFPSCERKEFVCEEHPDIDACRDDNGDDDDDDENIKIIIKNIEKKVFVNENNHHHQSFPDIDIIGLSTKASGESMICLMDIDDSRIQCQEFGMEPTRVNQAFWRVIETDHDKDFDNGNTGSSDVDDAIEDIKSQDFSGIQDADNHDFGINLAWIAINSQGDGVTCLANDSTGVGNALCEPFKVSAQDVDGQITEGVAID